ncbi:polysaccharide lyase family 7 protein [Flavobacterium sp. NG2]|uniref:polysaccharide lyase family 7 protein n=1 Tax=Flavobacterium sp. NG2 TaxID=3097547 RepID=UPI002A80293C|nr:polysaccharide lyase family 7 protein [Flavobacterium sp. NG2]WPR72845.1 polysaccharide lyase family 7 protein [Flavobacterium sp. NG2]
MNKQTRNTNSVYFYALCIMFLCFSKAVMAQVPSNLMRNCNQWKITYPTGVEDKTLCGEPNNEFFFVNPTGNAIVFKAPVRSDNGTTPNSSNIRSELRERTTDGLTDIYWTTTGTHALYVKQAITHLPIKKPQLVATQIHGDKTAGIDDSMVMRLEGTNLFLSFNGGKLRSNVSIKTNYTLGTIHEVIFKVVNGKHYCYYSEDGNLWNAYKNGTASSYLIKAEGNDYVMDKTYDQSYFKVGNYTQSNPTEEGTSTGLPDNYGEVVVYDFDVDHTGAGFGIVTAATGVTLSPKTATVQIGKTQQLIASVNPSNASNKTVTYRSSDQTIATVSTSGIVTGLKAGSVTITATTDDGGFTDTSVITVSAATLINTGTNGNPVSVTTNSEQVGGTNTNYAINTLDKSTSTKWADNANGGILTYDLGSLYTLESIKIATTGTATKSYYYGIRFSTDGVNYSATTNVTSNSDAEFKTFAFANQARYVQIIGGGNSTSAFSTITEIEFYGQIYLSVKGNTFNNAITVFPVPARNDLTIESATNTISKIELYAVDGKKVFEKNTDNSNRVSLDVSAFPKGNYIIKVQGTDDSLVSSKQIMITN